MKEKIKKTLNIAIILMSAVLFIVLLVVILVAYFYNSESEEQAIKTQLLLQEQCADTAKNFFWEDKWGRVAEDINSSNVNYTNHYNSKYNKCFVLITERYSDGSGTSLALYDVLDHKEYANGSFGLTASGVYCTILNGDCKTISDFNKFISEYMEN